MKHLIILSAILFSGSLLAQSEYCGAGTIWDAESQTCIVAENVELLDANLDGIIGVEDLLNLLSHFGDEDMDFDGIYDSVDDCVGAYDECGVCNGDGPQIPVIDEITVLYDSVYAEAIDEWWVFEVGIDTLYTFVCEAVPGCTSSEAYNFNPEANIDDGSCVFDFQNCGDPIFYMDELYATVEIAGRCWYKENSRYLPEVSPPDIGSEDDQGPHAYVLDYYGSDPEEAKAVPHFTWKGALYNHAALVEWEICPSGWHLPFDEEFQELEIFLGIDENEVEQYGLIGENEALLLKSAPDDEIAWDGTNDYGFSALPSGSRWFLGESFSGEGSVWFSTQDLFNSDRTICHRLYSGMGQIERNRWGHIHDAHSVRCIKD